MKKFIIALPGLAVMVTAAPASSAPPLPRAADYYAGLPSGEAAAQCVEDAWVDSQGLQADEAKDLSTCGPVNPRLWDSSRAGDLLELVLDDSSTQTVWVWGVDGELDKVESAVRRMPHGEWACDFAFWAKRHENFGRAGSAPTPRLYEAGAYPFAIGSPPVCPDPADDLRRFADHGASAPVAKAPTRRAAPTATATTPAAPAVVSVPVAPVAPVADAAPTKGGEVEAVEPWEDRRQSVLLAARMAAREDAAWERAGRPVFRLGAEGNADLGAYTLQDSYRGVRYTAVKRPAFGWAVSLGMSQVFGLPMAKPEPDARLVTIATLSVEGWGGGLQYGGVQAGVRASLVWAKAPTFPLAVGWRFGVRGDAYNAFSLRGAGSLMLPGVGTTHEVVLQIGAPLRWNDAFSRAPLPTLWVAGGVYAPMRWASAWATKPGLVLPSPTVSVGFALQAR